MPGPLSHHRQADRYGAFSARTSSSKWLVVGGHFRKSPTAPPNTAALQTWVIRVPVKKEIVLEMPLILRYAPGMWRLAGPVGSECRSPTAEHATGRWEAEGMDSGNESCGCSSGDGRRASGMHFPMARSLVSINGKLRGCSCMVWVSVEDDAMSFKRLSRPPPR